MTKALLVHTNGKIEHLDIDPTLKRLQMYVQGYIEHVYVNPEVHCYINEEGKLNDLPLNMVATILAGRAEMIDPLVGEVIFLGSDADGEDIDLPPEWQAL